MENLLKSDETLRRYGRDYLLQLRMHPLSLQKPENLPDSEIVKDRLYLHQIDNIGSQYINDSQFNYCSDGFRTSMKSENINKFLHQRTLPGYVPRGYSLYTSGQKSSSVLPLSKYRASFSPSYFNPLQKHLFRTSSAYKADISTEDFFENVSDIQTAPWFKETYPVYASENEWNYSQKILEKSCPSKHENVGCNPKSKKKLSIIDPKTGKDILDGICETSTTSQSSISSKENTEEEIKTVSPETAVDVVKNQEKSTHFGGVSNDYGDTGISIGSDEDFSYLAVTSKQSGDSAALSLSHDSSDEEFLKEYSNCTLSTSKNENILKSVESGDNEKGMGANFTCSEICKDKENLYSSNMEYSAENAREFADIPSVFEKKIQRSKDMKTPPTVSRNTSVSNNEMSDSVAQQGNSGNDLKEKIIMLRDRVYSMKQEQQKMAILQSFLLFKKNQLDESFRNLDDKKIDIVNWEYNLYNKDKKLHEKEYWLEVKIRNLKTKEKQLEDKEKWVDLKIREMENKYKNILKRDGVSGNAHICVENGSAKGQDEIFSEDKMSNKEMSTCEGNRDIRHNSSKTTVKDDKTISLKSKEYSSDNESETQTVSATQQIFKVSDQSPDLPPLHNKKMFISEGRKYFPEHIKYWLNHNENKVVENTACLKNIASDKVATRRGGQEKYDSNSKRVMQDEKTDLLESKDFLSADIRKTQIASTREQKIKTYDPSPGFNHSSNKKVIISEGRKYLPEHLKYWLNQREKETAENDAGSENMCNKKVATGKRHQENNDSNSKTVKKDEKINPLKSKDYSSGDISDKQVDLAKQQKLKVSEPSPDLQPPSDKQVIISEGRKYLPEQIKCWLNHKEKKAMENATYMENKTG